jgi:hypothetical protein
LRLPAEDVFRHGTHQLTGLTAPACVETNRVPVNLQQPITLGNQEKCTQLARTGLLDLFAGRTIQQSNVPGGQCHADHSVVLGQELSTLVGIGDSKLQLNPMWTPGGRNAHLYGGHLRQLPLQSRLPIPDKASGSSDSLMNLDEPPVRIGIITPRRQPYDPQAVGKSDKTDDRRFVGCCLTTVDELLGLVRLEG